MIKHTTYPDKVVATYSEGDCWHETIAEYFKKHTNFEEHACNRQMIMSFLKGE